MKQITNEKKVANSHNTEAGTSKSLTYFLENKTSKQNNVIIYVHHKMLTYLQNENKRKEKKIVYRSMKLKIDLVS